ncbi:Na/Pi cotransporter family protein [Stappia sp. F7233]|uniref:Na/Pi cotransporter family protein n=1 Tax=Stappia albiluteola TaxID=2758565 RepID=A0A839ABE2_9HYPH|nr:Na/Pi symporter [Stappia albiluteola]MBA5776913.1 Na/Pi cotransporter family protein [Stappia albiluteola]
MTGTILTVLGGIGLFLLGMIVLTDGLKSLAGNTMRAALARHTQSPLSGAVAGAATTALVQSSSATTVTVVGFVGAGLLTFPQALGVIFGANIGSTATGWLVTILGLKLQLGAIVLPLVFVGVLLRLFGRGRVRHIGWAMAGFSLLFIGLDALQKGMAVFEGTVTPTDFPADDTLGRLQLILTGVVITLVTQASSVGVATALVALGAGAISFPQAAALVIGMDIGTTCTAALATIGGSTAMRQTGLAHVIYNLMTGAMAFFLLTPYATFVSWLQGGQIGNGQIALVAFHTTFNVLGVVLILPFAGAFAKLVQWLVPDRGAPLLRRLDQRLLADPQAAIDAAAPTVREIAAEAFAVLASALSPTVDYTDGAEARERVGNAIDATRDYLQKVRTGDEIALPHRRHIACMHALDHLERLDSRLKQQVRIDAILDNEALSKAAEPLRLAGALPADADLAALEATLERESLLLEERDRRFREETFDAAALQRVDADTALLRLDAMRWLQRSGYHLWRIVHHLRIALGEDGQNGEPAKVPKMS